ncbi:sensor histidine kinase [Spirulina subsalsa FACHB-351]|uniref:Sensor histidine kinase n=1 Tax=Spirulina subsalsa FACHB-351 TaxID=234711 RepID=A0ABT3L0R7_9CYAN|nr:sensor histidine kinase [Spirulina subsalsa FACHB-351]
MHNSLNSSPVSYFSSTLHDLSLESTLAQLSLFSCVVSTEQTGTELAAIFEQYPQLPGAILVDTQDKTPQFVGMISRRQLLEYLLLPHGIELFLPRPLAILHHYQRGETLVLKGDTHILEGNRQALRRSPTLITEPIIVQLDPQTYHILDFGQLSLVAWQIRGIETQIRYERSQAQMIQSEKMASLGRLVDGVAHEILDPVGFIWGNLTYISRYSDQLMELLQAYEKILPTPPTWIQDLQEDIELDYLKQDLSRIVNSITTGAQRLKTLASSLQNFCHVDEVYPKPADIHSCLDGILLLLKSRISREIRIVKKYGQLPPVMCYSGKLSQVFINIFTQAINSLLEQAVTQEIAQEFDHPIPNHDPAQITIITQVISRNMSSESTLEMRFISIRIIDNGPGMSQAEYQQFMDSFSLKNRADIETSWAVSYQIITAKHGGEFWVKSQLGFGTEFEILLPLGEG